MCRVVTNVEQVGQKNVDVRDASGARALVVELSDFYTRQLMGNYLTFVVRKRLIASAFNLWSTDIIFFCY